jgi:hypothetical protein
MLIADYLSAKGQKFALIDCDTESAGTPASFSHWFGGKTNMLDLRDVADLDTLLRQSANSGVGYVLADLPANSGGDITDWLHTVATPKTIQSLGLRIIAVGAVNPSAGSGESVAQWMDTLGTRATYLVTLNRTQFERKPKPVEKTFAAWFNWIESQVKKPAFQTVEIPHLHEHTMLALTALAKLPCKAIKDPALDVILRFRLETWTERVHSQLDATGLFIAQTAESLVAAK